MRKQLGHRRGALTIIVETLVPTDGYTHDPLPETVLGIALDQRAFGPRKLMVAFAAYDGTFLALTYARRTDPPHVSLEACLHHFTTLDRGEHDHAAAVVLCDEPVKGGPAPSEFIAKFEHARALARRYNVHLVDWIGCDDDLFRCARRQTFEPAPEPGWWDVPG